MQALLDPRPRSIVFFSLSCGWRRRRSASHQTRANPPPPPTMWSRTGWPCKVLGLLGLVVANCLSVSDSFSSSSSTYSAPLSYSSSASGSKQTPPAVARPILRREDAGSAAGGSSSLALAAAAAESVVAAPQLDEDDDDDDDDNDYNMERAHDHDAGIRVRSKCRRRTTSGMSARMSSRPSRKGRKSRSSVSTSTITTDAFPDQLTVCTLVDGRQTTLSSDVEVEVPHLLETARSPSKSGEGDVWTWDTSGSYEKAATMPDDIVTSVVLIDCDGENAAQIIERVDALQDKMKHAPFRYTCVNTTDEAKEEWASMWIDGVVDHHIFPETYITKLRLALHQCLRTECRTRYCAWSDSDLVMVPHFSSGWAQGGLDCLLGSSESFGDEKDSPVFITFPELSQEIPHMPSKDAHWGAVFAEFSSQAFVVDRHRLFNEWLPISLSTLNYTDSNKYLSKWNLHLRPEPFQSAIERIVVAKAATEYVRCRQEGRNCMPVASCEPPPAWKVYYDDYKHEVQERQLAAKDFVNKFSRAFVRLQEHSKLDDYVAEIAGYLENWIPPPVLHR